jgi:histidyl-tRNA synthetase
MQSTKVERIRGANDLLPDDYEINCRIEDKLRECFRSFGYRPIDVPLIEHTELYLRKSGVNIIPRLYDFTYQNRRLCLRPEMTASVIRAYVDHLQGRPLPVRLYYRGPVFRYEKPQRGTYRQFTQVGVELIGAGGPTADAEIISTACKSLNLLGLADYQVVIGHIAILSEFLESIALEGHLRSFLLANMEALRRHGKQHTVHRLCEIYPSFQAQTSKENVSQRLNAPKIHRTGKLARLFQDMDVAEARMVILDLLESMNIALDDSRDPDEIIDRVLTKMKRQDQTLRLNQALDFMSELGQLVGEPSQVLREAKKLLTAHGSSHAPLDRLSEIIEILKCYDLDWSRIDLDCGLSRGLQYHTDMIFEIYHGALEEKSQLCGGGRYDDLIATLGGRENIPATGFSFGLERVRLALENVGKLSAVNHKPTLDALVVSVNSADLGYAIGVAERLRNVGLSVEIDVRDRSVTSNFQYGNKRGVPFAVVVGSDERLASKVVLKDMASRKEQRVTVNDAINQINEARKHYV